MINDCYVMLTLAVPLYSYRFLPGFTSQGSVYYEVYLVVGYVIDQRCSRSRNFGLSRESYRRGKFTQYTNHGP
jgi:hypothetical protein